MGNDNHMTVTGVGARIAKLGLAAALIWAVGWIILVLDSRGEVQSSHADIFALNIGPAPWIERYNDALEDLGHDEPRPYELNGNKIYFSVNHIDAQSVHQVVADYQRAMVDHRLNAKAHLSAGRQQADARTREALTGGVVPQVITDDYFSMGGMAVRGGAESVVDVIRNYEPAQNEAEMFEGHRWIEGFRAPGASHITVISSWSDDFDYQKMIPGHEKPGANRGNVDDLPAPIGGKRVLNFDDFDPDTDYRSAMYTTSAPIAQVGGFYHRLYTRRGWTPRAQNWTLAELAKDRSAPGTMQNGQLLNFTRDDDMITVAIYAMPSGKTAVQLSKKKVDVDL